MTELRVDLDGPVPRRWWRRLVFVAHLCGLRIDAVMFARSQRNGMHVTVRVRGRIAPVEVVAYQAILGSDPIREAINLVRVRYLAQAPPFWRHRWNLLFSQYWVGPTSRRRRSR